MDLLPVDYFHNVFTLPHELNPLVLCNKKVAFGILFRAVSETLLQFGKDPRSKLRGKAGFISILHTWDQKLRDHFHLHCVIPFGVLSFDNRKWIRARKNFLFPVRALSQVFRAKFIEYLKEAFQNNKFIFPGQLSPLGTEPEFEALLRALWKKEWVVYSKKSFAGPNQVLDYLGRYTHRVAISNHRIIEHDNGKVTFHYKDRSDGDKDKTITLTANEFIRRFLLHVVPKSFVRIRHFGFLANRSKKEALSSCRIALQTTPPPTPPQKTVEQFVLLLTGIDITLCPICKKGKMRKIRQLPKKKSLDTS